MVWTCETLGDICREGGGRIQTGPFGSQLHESDYSMEGIPVVMPADIMDGKVSTTRIVRVSENHVERLKRHKLNKGDIVYGRRGDIGRQALVKDENAGWLCGTGCLKISLGAGPLTYEFLHRYLSTSAVIGWIEGQAIGATMPNLNTGILERVPVFYPRDQVVQKKIAAILSAYDELIENNQRRITLLEKMAEEIYREWFVRLRFPGYEKVKKIKGVPEGWQISELQDVSIEASRSVKAGAHLADRYYLPLDMLNTRKMNPDGHLNYTEAQSSLVTFEKGDILFGAMRPYLQKVAIAPLAGITRTTCFVIRPRTPQSLSWLFLTLFQQSSVDYASMICNGSDRPYAVWNKGMERMKLLCPDDALLSKFDEAVRPILDSITSMYFVQLKLRDCRDTLLPRLISGKLSVEHLDIRFQPGMEERQ